VKKRHPALSFKEESRKALKGVPSSNGVSSSCVEPELIAKKELKEKIKGIKVVLGSSEEDETYVSVSARDPIRQV